MNSGYEELTGGSGYQGKAQINKEQSTNTPKENNVEVIGFVRKFWAGFHNAVIISLLFSLVGVGIGVRIAKDYYVQKLDEVVHTGAMLHKQKVYTIQPKI